MPAKRPNGARNETIRCENCGEYYAVTYKRCPFCEEDEPTRIFRRPKSEEPVEEVRPRRARAEDEEAHPPVRPARPAVAEDTEDEYEELFRHRPTPHEEDVARPARRSVPPREEDEVRKPRRRDADDDYDEPPRRRSRREEGYDEDEYEPRRSRREEDYDDEEDDYDYGRRGDGGKRLVTNARGGGYRHKGPSPMQIISAVLSIALFGAAVWIVFTIVKSFTDDPTPPVDDPTPGITSSVPPVSTPAPTGGEDEPGDIVVPSDDPNSQPPAVTGTPETPPPVTTTIPSGQTATGFSLYNQWGTMVQDITLKTESPSATLKAVFTPEGSTGTLTWHSSKPNIATVDQSGTVTGVAQGVTTITVSMAGGYTRECKVRSEVGGTPGPAPSVNPSPSQSTAPSVSPSPSQSTPPSNSPSAGGTLSMNVGLGLDGKTYDFSLKIGESWNLKVKNAAGAVNWSVKDSGIASVDASGKVSGVAKGQTTITASVDGQTLECIVRVN